MKKFYQICICILFLCTNVYAADNVEKKSGLEYKIEQYSCFESHKCSFDVRINSKFSEDELLTIAYEIYDDIPAVNRVFIMFYLPCMKVGNGAWASIIFDPTPKVTVMDFMLSSNKTCNK